MPEQLENEATQETYWEAAKFVGLALKANPNVLECLYTPLVEKATPLAAQPIRSSMVVAARTLPVGTIVSDQHVKTIEWTGGALPLGPPMHKLAAAGALLASGAYLWLSGGGVPTRFRPRKAESPVPKMVSARPETTVTPRRAALCSSPWRRRRQSGSRLRPGSSSTATAAVIDATRLALSLAGSVAAWPIGRRLGQEDVVEHDRVPAAMRPLPAPCLQLVGRLAQRVHRCRPDPVDGE